MDMPEVPEPTTPPSPDTPTSPLVGFTLTTEQKIALVSLGGLTVVALILAAMLRARRRRGNDMLGLVALPESGPAPSADIVASLRYLAQATGDRFAGIQQQLDALHEALGTRGPATEPSPTIDQFNMGGAASNGNGVSHQTYEQAIADQPENVVPGPAATSQP